MFFCDQGAFSGEQTRRILAAGKAAGLQARIHANQLSHSDAVAIAVEYDAASADHLGQSSIKDIEMLAASNTVATLLPGAEFSTQNHEKIGRKFLDAGVRVAIASDCNPGSSYTTSMSFCIAAAVNLLGFTVEEALHAATAGGAAALRRTDIGHLAPGARADFAILDAPSYIHLAYRQVLISLNKLGRTEKERTHGTSRNFNSRSQFRGHYRHCSRQRDSSDLTCCAECDAKISRPRGRFSC